MIVDILYMLMPTYRKEVKCVQILHRFTEKVSKNRAMVYLKLLNYQPQVAEYTLKICLRPRVCVCVCGLVN